MELPTVTRYDFMNAKKPTDLEQLPSPISPLQVSRKRKPTESECNPTTSHKPEPTNSPPSEIDVPVMVEIDNSLSECDSSCEDPTNPVGSNLFSCEQLLLALCSISNDNLIQLNQKSVELLAAFEACKPRHISTHSQWQILYLEIGKILSQLKELSTPLLFSYCRYLMLSYENDKDFRTIICLLERVIKSSPYNTQAWNYLGECYWEIGQVQQALDCFLGAVQHDPNCKEGFRNLAIVYRQLDPQGSVKYTTNLQLSLKYAQQAVDCDKDDGKSWMILGNVMLSQHFHSQKTSKDLLKKCIICYRLAENDANASKCSDLYTNFGTVFICLEEFNSAIQCYSKAALLDPQSDNVNFKVSSVLSTFRTIQTALEHSYRISNDKISQYAQKCSMKMHIDNYTVVGLAELKTGDGINPHRFVNLTVIQVIEQAELVSSLAVCVDVDSVIVICNLHGLSQIGIVRESYVITILCPVFKIQKVDTVCGIKIHCPWISSTSPEGILIDGSFIPKHFFETEALKIQAYT
ncbi:Tetratricopeptide repeat protein 5-like [Oopsacas minuta]|uniref:Cell division cycle protein 27 homolog n=1 Tax=Oopsacas minuta TaxID=111878 RepID=A0AAV7JED4_9METZ|nr:Tetratricopeptide repeat protein 5-like [Oopsacas minuta]